MAHQLFARRFLHLGNYPVRIRRGRPQRQPGFAARGLLDIIAKLVTLYEPTHVIACWDDDWRPQWRVDLIPSYKAHRVAELVEAAPDVEEVPTRSRRRSRSSAPNSMLSASRSSV